MKNPFKKKPRVPSIYKELQGPDSGNMAAKILMYVIVGMLFVGLFVMHVIPRYRPERIAFSNRNYYPTVVVWESPK